MIVRCTLKVLKLLGERPAADAEPGVDDWYLNLLWLDRRKCLLLVHATTLFPVFTADVRAAELRPLRHWIRQRVQLELDAEGLPADALGDLDTEEVVVTKTASRRMLGIMNDMAMHAEFAIYHAGGIAGLDVADLNRTLRRGLHTHGGDYARPLELALQHLREKRNAPATHRIETPVGDAARDHVD